MVLRIMFFALMAVGLVGFGTVAWISTRPPPPPPHVAAPPPPAKVAVLGAARPLRAGSLLKPEDLAAKEILVSDRSDDMSADTPDARRALSGAMVRRSLSAGEPIRPSDVMRPGDHGFLAAVLQPGMRAVTVAVDATTGAAGLIWPGDRVDLILTQTI
jgi:pilus assembly protein CpaB